MAREKNSRRLSKFWWVLAFAAGTAAGALSLEFLHAQNTLWVILFVFTVAGAVAFFEQFGDPANGGIRLPNNPGKWGRSGIPNHPQPPRKQVNGKRPDHRAQLHAIAGKKGAEPPSSGTS